MESKSFLDNAVIFQHGMLDGVQVLVHHQLEQLHDYVRLALHLAFASEDLLQFWVAVD